MLATGASVFPTPVGVNRLGVPLISTSPCFPHTRGGEPSQSLIHPVTIQGFPHTRGGEPMGRLGWSSGSIVFPTPVGVNQNVRFYGQPRAVVFPTPVGVNRHVVGGDDGSDLFSPHPWG